MISMRPILLGSETMILVTSAEAPVISMERLSAEIPMIVSIQEAREVAARSVGENASPLPWLSTGASVMILLPDFR